jgi:hypothetical protein
LLAVVIPTGHGSRWERCRGSETKSTQKAG